MCRIFAVKILTWWLHIYDYTVMVNRRHIYGAMHATRTRHGRDTDATRTRHARDTNATCTRHERDMHATRTRHARDTNAGVYAAYAATRPPNLFRRSAATFCRIVFHDLAAARRYTLGGRVDTKCHKPPQY